MNDYQKYVQLLKQQYSDIKTEAHLAQIRQMLDSHREILAYFKAANHEIESRISQKPDSAEKLIAFVSDVKTHLGNFAQLKELLNALNRFENIGDQLKHTIRQLGEYCMNNLSLDDILKASAGAETLKQQAEQQQNAVEKVQAMYLIHQGLISFFAGVNRQFQGMMQTANINAKTADAFLTMFEQHIKDLSGLKFQIGRTKTGGYAELENLIRYCREEMTLYELQHSISEMESVKASPSSAIEVSSRLSSMPDGDFTNSLGMTFRLIPSGTFIMGFKGGDYQVTISKAFYMQTTQVTLWQWEAVMGDHFRNGEDNHPKRFSEDSWDYAVRFINKLNQMEGGNKYRLPTEAEWEYACRAGSTTAYCFGDNFGELDNYAWYDGNSGGEIHQVGLLKPNAWGLYDMHGNVWEWCKDWYGKYPTGTVTDPIGPITGSDRVLRGGSYYTRANYCMSATRGARYAPDWLKDIGFRLVREAD